MTIPAIRPADKPRPAPLSFEESPVAEDPLLDVELGKSGAMVLVVGRVTSSHRELTSELMQQESVELGELEAQ